MSRCAEFHDNRPVLFKNSGVAVIKQLDVQAG